jgi:tetratricopeptide (TPR) repeat protein
LILASRTPFQARLGLALCRWSVESRDEALTVARSASEVADRALGPDHPTTWAVRHALAVVHARRGESEIAIALSERTVAGYERILGPLHSETYWARFHLARALERAGRVAEARAVATDLLERSVRIYGVAHADTLGRLKDAVRLLRAEGDLASVRDLAAAWTQRLLETPTRPDTFSRRQRSVALEYLALTLAALPPDIPVDTTLIGRGVEQAMLQDRGWYPWTVLAAIECLRGRLDRSVEALERAARQPNWESGNDLYWFVAASVHARLGQREPAIAAYRRAGAPETKHDSWREVVEPFRTEAEARLGAELPDATNPPEPVPGTEDTPD